MFHGVSMTQLAEQNWVYDPNLAASRSSEPQTTAGSVSALPPAPCSSTCKRSPPPQSTTIPCWKHQSSNLRRTQKHHQWLNPSRPLWTIRQVRTKASSRTRSGAATDWGWTFTVAFQSPKAKGETETLLLLPLCNAFIRGHTSSMTAAWKEVGKMRSLSYQ